MKTTKKLMKILIVLIILELLVMVPAAHATAMSGTDTVADLRSVFLREGGPEESGTLTTEGQVAYDQTKYIYKDVDTIGDNIPKIVEDLDGENFSNALYSLDAYNSLPETAEEYSNVSDFFDITDINVKSLELGVQFNDYSDVWEQNYNSLKWLFKNMYLRHQTPEQKDAFLGKAFKTTLDEADDYDETLEYIKENLTDDDIDFVQQFVIWYFTKGEYLNDYYEGEWISAYDVLLVDEDENEEYCYDLNSDRADFIDGLQSYLIEEAVKHSDGSEVSPFPTMIDYGDLAAEVEGNYFKAGPFEVDDSLDGSDPSTYSIKLVDQDGVEINRSDYIIKIDGVVTTENLDEILDQAYYIYLPNTTDITEVRLELSYEEYNTDVSLWKQSVVNVDTYAPVILVTREAEDITEEQSYRIERPGTYNIKVIAQDANNGDGLEDAEIRVMRNSVPTDYETDENGIISINNIEISGSTPDEIVITEQEAPPNYNKVTGALVINAVKELVNGTLKIDDVEEVYSNNGMDFSFNATTQTITIIIDHEEVTANTGSYTLDLTKIDKEDDSPLSDAEFKIEVNGNYIESSPGNTTFVSGSNGKLIIPTQSITNSSADLIKITEITPPDGYAETDEVLEITINKKIENNTYKVDNITSKVKVGGVETVSENITASYNSTTNIISIVEKNELDSGGISGSYTLEIIKVDENDNPITNYPAQFEVTVNGGTPRSISTVNSVAGYGTVRINSVDNPDEIIIEETNAPDGYDQLIDDITVSVTKQLNVDTYIATSASTLDNYATATLSGNKVTVKIENEKKELDYTIYYKENGINKTLSNPKHVTGKGIGDVVSESAIDIAGYRKLEPSSANITITSGTNEYTFYYQIETYNITYNYNGGTLPEGKTNVSQYTVETENITVNNPEKTGYTFLGWTENTDDDPELTKVIEKGTTGNIVLTANWSANTYEITLDNKDATTNGTNKIYEVYEENIYLDSEKTIVMTTASNAITKPQRMYNVTFKHNYFDSVDTTKTGVYVFNGYYDGNAQMISSYGLLSSNFLKNKYLENKTLEAKWTEGLITYIPVRTGYTFEGWFEDETCTGTRVDDNGVYIPSTDKILYAKWTSNTYELTLDNKDATTNGTDKIYEIYGNNIYLDNAKTKVMTTSTNNITIPQRKYDVTYKHNYTGSTDEIKTGTYTFEGYYDGGAQVIGTEGYITNNFTVTKFSEDKTLTAKWSGGLISYIPERTGYTFVGWFENEDLSGTRVDSNGDYTPLQNKTLYAKWTANTVAYKVEHWKQKVSGTANLHDSTNYTLVETDNLTGTADSEVTPLVKTTYTGFTAPSTQTVTIKPDGSLVLNYYYTRNSYTVTLNKGTGINTVTGSGSYLYEANVTIGATLKDGYHWKNWTGAENTNEQSHSFTMPASSVTYTANGEANTYTVAYNGNGATGGTTSSSSHTYDEFKNLTTNGFERKYTVTFKHNYSGTSDRTENVTYTFNKWTTESNGTGNSYTNEQSVKNLSSTNGETVNLFAQWNSASVTYNPERTGYTFIGWFENENGTGTRVDTNGSYVPTENKVLYAKWTAGTVPYVVEHWKQNLTGNADQHDSTNYTLSDRDNEVGEADESVTPAVKTYNGFTAPSTQTVNIKPDGTLVVNYYYTRNSYEVNLNKGTGINTVTGSGTYLYEANVTINATLEVGYHWKNWTGAENTNEQSHSFTMPASNVTDTANGEANTYTIIYNGNGATGGNTQSSSHIYDVEKNLTPNGYERKYTVTFKHNYSGSSDVNQTATYTFGRWSTNSNGNGETYSNNAPVKNLSAINGGTVNLFAEWITGNVLYNPTRTGYTFIGWFDNENCNGTRVDTNGSYVPTENKVLYAKWSANAVGYTVEHWQQDLTGNAMQHDETNYSFVESDSFTGESDSQVTPLVKTYVGFTSPSTQTVRVNPNGNLVVKYYYTRNSYPVTLNKGDGIETVTGGGNHLFEEQVTISAEPKEGYHWKNWTGTHNQDGQSYVFTMPASSVTDTANAEANTYTVTYNGNGATGGETLNSSHIYNVEKTLTPNGYERKYTVTFIDNFEGHQEETRTSTYTFSNWSINSDGNGKTYSNNESVKNLTTVNGGEVKLYAIWNAENLNNLPTKLGYKFDGWFENEDLSGTRVDTNGNYTPTQNKTLYAKWSVDETQTKPLSYTVNYYKDNTYVSNEVVRKDVYVLDPDTLDLDRSLINNNDKFEGYMLDRTEPETVEDVVNNNAVINVYYVKKAQIIVKHIDDDDENKRVMYTDTITGKVGDVKTVHEREIDGYTVIRRPDSETITMTETPIEVSYYYSLIKGYYNIEITSSNEKDSNEKLQGITFGVKVGDKEEQTVVTNENGLIGLNDVCITKEGTEKITIREISTRDDYYPLEGALEIDVSYEKDGTTYKIVNAEATSNEWNSTISLDTDTSTLKIQNKHDKIIVGSYNLTIQPISQDGELIGGNLSTIDINNTQEETTEGVIKRSNVLINKYNVDTSDIYEIKEISVPEKYNKYDGKVKLEVVKKLADDETKYEVQDVIMVVTNENGEEVLAPVDIILEVNGDDIVLKIKNYEKIDLTLKTFISAVSEDETINGEDILTGDKSREPIVEVGENITFNQTKEELEVSENNYLLYKVRIYNTGNVNAIASQISNYLPEDMEFVTDAPQNNIWTYDENEHKITTNDNYVPETIDKYVSGQQPEYAELEFVLKIKPGVAKDINLYTRAFLVRSNYTDGTANDESAGEEGQDFEKIVVIDYDHIDLSLKQYISAVSKDQTFEEEDYLKEEKLREPTVDIEKLDNREEKTAKYTQLKDTLRVRENDYILYKIRVHNEGNLNALANKIVNYIPDSLEFDSSIEANRIWTYDEETGSVSTNDNYTPVVLAKHQKGQPLVCQELDLILKVKENATEDVRLINIAEIVESTDETGNITADRDSSRNINKIEDYETNIEDDSDYESVIVAAIYGHYDLDIIAIDQDNNLIENQGTKFNVNNEEKIAEAGKASIKDNIIVKTNVQNIDTYLIDVKDISKDFAKFEGKVKLEIAKKISQDETKYEIDRDNTRVSILNSNDEVVDLDGVTVEIDGNDEKEVVSVKIVNYEKLDLALRKYVAAVSTDETFEEAEYLKNEKSRVPVVNTEKLDSGEETTAIYTHPKDVYGVKRNNYILYKIRLYNEGNKDGYAVKVIDHLPEELTFIKTASENSIWNYDESSRKITTNENYVPKLLTKHTSGQELDYQELSVVARVKLETEELVDISNYAEISEIKYADGKNAEDRDSIVGNLVYSKNNSIIDQEDDEDVEKIEVTPNTGSYDIEIVITDKAGNKITASNATININGQDRNTQNGILTIPNIQITKTNVDREDLYEIVEIKEPDGYSRFTSNMNVTITKKEAADRSKYEVDNVSMEVVSPYGEVSQGKNIKVENRNGKTVVVITIENEKKEATPSGSGGQNSNNGNVPNGSSAQGQINTNGSGMGTNYGTIINNIPAGTGSTTIRTRGSGSTSTDGSSNKAINVRSTSTSQKEDVTPSATGDDTPGIVLNVIFLVIVANIIQMRIYKKRQNKKVIK